MNVKLELNQQEAQIALAYIWAEAVRQRDPEKGSLQAVGVLRYIHDCIEKVAIKEENKRKDERLRAVHNQLENALDEVRELMARDITDDAFYSTADSAQARAGEVNALLLELLKQEK